MSGQVGPGHSGQVTSTGGPVTESWGHALGQSSRKSNSLFRKDSKKEVTLSASSFGTDSYEIMQNLFIA